MKCFNGFSLVETMLSVVLSSLIGLMVFNLYLTIKQGYGLFHQELIKRQSLLQVVDFLNQEIRQAGFSPCINLMLTGQNDAPGLTIYPTSNERIPSAIKKRRVPNSDVLYWSRLAFDYSRVHAMADNSVWMLDKAIKLNEKKPILMADCQRVLITELLKKKSMPDKRQVIQLLDGLSAPLSSHAVVGQLQEFWLFVGNNSRKGHSLYLYDGRSEELIAAVHAMHVRWVTNKLLLLELELNEEKFNLYIGVHGLND